MLYPQIGPAFTSILQKHNAGPVDGEKGAMYTRCLEWLVL